MKGRKASGHNTTAGMLLATHPLMWGSVALLLLNDHVLKRLCPCWLTGKLSDLAGIVVLGAMLLVVLAPLADRLRLKRPFAIVATAVASFWLALKLWPAGNAAITRAAEAILGHSTWYVLDPSDLLALAMLAPLGLAWRGCVERAREGAGVPMRRALPVLAAASVALVATSPAPAVFWSAERLYTEGGWLYAVDLDVESTRVFRRAARSQDGGRTWVYVEDSEVPQSALHAKAPGSMVCSQVVPALCYRIAGSEQVQVSHNGGTSWENAYSVAPGRSQIMQRWHRMRDRSRRWGMRPYDGGPFDVAIVTWQEEEVLVVACGTEGVLCHPLPNGAWERNAVGFAAPTPHRQTRITTSVALAMPEISILLVLSMLVGNCVRLVSLVGFRGSVSNSARSLVSNDWSSWPHTVLTVVYLLVLFISVSWVYSYSTGRLTPTALAISDAFLILLYALATSLGAPPNTENELPTWADVLPVWGTAALVFLASSLPWYLWAAGVIWAHSTALIVSLAAGLASTALVLWWSWRRRRCPTAD